MLDELRKSVNDAMYSCDAKMVTSSRGRLIAELKKNINELSKIESPTDEDKALLDSLVNEYNQEVHNHRVQVQARYSNEFIKEPFGFKDIFQIPKNVMLSAKSTVQCIEELKAAKTTKQKIFGTLEVIKAFGMTLATPVIALGKCLIDQWYVPLGALTILEATDSDFVRGVVEKTGLQDSPVVKGLDAIRENPIVKPIYNKFDEATDYLGDMLGITEENIPDASNVLKMTK